MGTGSGCPNGHNPARMTSAIPWDKNNALTAPMPRCCHRNPVAAAVVEMRALAATSSTSGKELILLSVAGIAARVASAAVAAFAVEMVEPWEGTLVPTLEMA